MDGIMGGASAFLGGQLGNLLAKPISSLTSDIASPVLREALRQGALNATTSFGLTTGMAKLNGASWKDALSAGGKAALMNGGIGMMTGAATGIKSARENNQNPWTGENKIDVTAKDLGLSGTMERIGNGESYPHRNDGSVFDNNKNILPVHKGGYYKEYVHPTPGIKGVGPQRIVTGGKGEFYYTPDHYKTFIRFKY
ncbi:ribonuclease domain-containing protein [Parabacteroides sp. Marseille-P3160]|uniref:ribonuclease domain-containing protein n=1 Tax=Parabacteroides sp. Marseille-P3160 TaxID=1917887 RepID=UPI00190EC33F|nr:ribonuclease domain-containing protein [Parabacteroides sp. Marseille-P3160]